MATLDRKSEAVEPGRIVAVGVASTPVLNDAELDGAVKVYVLNNSAQTVTLRLAAAGAVPGAGLVLAPGGAWDEDRYAGALCACHHGSAGTVDLTVVIV